MAAVEALYRQMARMRAFELALADLWADGRISGELHLGIGEEGIVAGVVSHLTDGDALALDHRSTPPLVARGVDLEAMLLEMLGHDEGLSGGHGGHMHLLVPDRLAASSGIVGSSGPLACGFGLSAKQLRPGSVVVAFFGEGAMNQGMLLEAFNLAVVWDLPVLFVCKDDGWSITTRSRTVTGGSLIKRAAGFGLPTANVDGWDVEAVEEQAGRLIDRARAGKGPAFLHATCHRPRGHFEDFQLFRLVHEPSELAGETGAVLKGAMSRGGADLRRRLTGVASVVRTLAGSAAHQFMKHPDPLRYAARSLASDVVQEADAAATGEVAAAVQRALGRMPL